MPCTMRTLKIVLEKKECRTTLDKKKHHIDGVAEAAV